MNISRNPASLPPPPGISAHAVEIASNTRVLYISGQVAIRSDGSIPVTIEEQTDVVWKRISAILSEAHMAVHDIVKITSFITKAEDYAGFAEVRARHLGAHRTASTAVIVAALVKPELLVEIEVVAARA